MKTLFRNLTLALAFTAALSAAEPTASELAEKLAALQQDGNSYVRLRLDVQRPGEAKVALQIQIKQRRTANATEVVYQVLWPKERKGEAVLLRRAGNQPLTGAIFTPPNTSRALAAVQGKEPLFGSDLYGEDVRVKVERCLAVRDAEVERADRLRAEYREQVEAALDGLDLVLTPTLPIVAPRLNRGGTGDLDVREQLIRFTYPFSALGWPALALPCGPAEDGLPASLQIAGRAGSDALVLAAARLLSPI